MHELVKSNCQSLSPPTPRSCWPTRTRPSTCSAGWHLETTYEETEDFSLTGDFLVNRERYLRRLGLEGDR